MVGNEAWRSQVREWIQHDYPNLAHDNYQITSSDTIDYNCVAWALEDTQRWWWPDSFLESYWPLNVPREETLDAFQELFQLFYYTRFLGTAIAFSELEYFCDRTSLRFI